MTEAEWLACTDPDQMLAYLESGASRRKLRLLCCACCRRVWHLLETESLRQAVDTFEHFADSDADTEEVRAAARTTHPLNNYREEIFARQQRDDVVWAAYAINTAMVALRGYSYRKAMVFFALAAGPGSDVERAAHVGLIREVFGNPFRPMAIPPPLLHWSDGIVVKLAAAVYEERSLPAGTLDAERLSILADALEEAGCYDADILGHLRGPGPHVRGCAVVDWLLGKS